MRTSDGIADREIRQLDVPARLARGGNRLLGGAAAVLILLIFAYGAFSLWNNYIISHRAFGSELLPYKPTPEQTDSFAELPMLNADVRGWLTIDGTHIDYPVVQGQYDYEYLNKDVFGQYAVSGSIFMSTTNASDFSDPYTLIYGHHMANGAMFGDVDRFLDAAFFNENRTGMLYLPDQSFRIELFACVACSAYDEIIYAQTSQVTDDLPGLVGYIRSLAVHERGIGIQNGDRIIALSTCADTATNGRHVLFGKLVPAGSPPAAPAR